ncbi:uL13 family ribosomal protein, partial [Candidatus Dojkabacteria bacterium]|nr:uL13 family ribosomal protein [Candidatus Dojkabacteria bacterium]
QNKLKDQRLSRLVIYKNSEHKHTAQKPTEIKF